MRARHIGILLQAENLFEHLTIEANISLQMLLAGKPDPARLAHLLDTLGLQELRNALPAQLSGGETARAALAVAMAAAPDVLLADEPTAEVDVETESRILELLARRGRQNKATLIATHSTAIAAGADRMTDDAGWPHCRWISRWWKRLLSAASIDGAMARPAR